MKREIIEDTDVLLFGRFGGLSSASYNRTGDIVYQDKLVNAFVNKRGEVVKRAGSQVNTSIAYFEDSTGNGVCRFVFDNTRYMVAKVGRSIVLMSTKDGVGYISFRTFNSLFAPKAANDIPSFAVKVEGNYCHVLIAVANAPMQSITIVKSILLNPLITGNTISGSLQVPVSGSVLTATNSIVRQNNTFAVPTSLTHTEASVSINVSSADVNSINTSDSIRIHSFFFLRFVDSQYYPGLYLVNSALRRNQVPLDVNVQVPQELQENPIINEPAQLVDRETLWIYSSNTKQTKVTNRQPANGNEWDFSDGGYFTGAGMLTNPSPSFVSFGGFSTLSSGGSNTTVQICRLRRVLVDGLTGNLRCHVDKQLRTPVYHDENTNPIAFSGVDPAYFSFASAGANLNLSSVVELTHVVTSFGLGSSVLVNLDPNDGSLVIGDGYCIPLYGYGFATSDGIYPSTVAFVGNRLVLVGRGSRVIFSHADWNYRGISFNNCQVSSINFSETSAFSVQLGQGSSVIKGLESVNGVAVVATDKGIFRISSASSATRPANANDAVVTRVSSEVIPNANCFTVFDNSLYYVSSNGLYSLTYEEQAAELVNQSMSEHVSDRFSNANSLSYLNDLRSFAITFDNSDEILAMNVDSQSYYSIRFATSRKPTVDNNGFTFLVAGNVGEQHLLICSFSQTQTTDLSNFSSVFSYSLPGRSITLTHLPTNVDNLVCPAELVQLLTTAKVTLASGSNHVRLIGSDSTFVVEYPTTNAPLPIDCYLVTKAFFSDRVDRAHRIRGISLLFAGAGSVTGALVQPTDDFVDRLNVIESWVVGEQTQQGEQMLNAAYPRYAARASAGNSNLVKLKLLGITEAWQMALRLNNVRLLGYQWDTSVKSRKRLH